ncbi:MAG: hypothetical protein QF689_01095 [Candidatus Latescibacteria bacterium]|nr:hypothetical protein [Gemmatimonadaceae bacterium]MDP6014565.1 hypothetical protein [Candidatus Latescibacterota bacterium]MDP7447157.1 hypothetical protein [Candidatus Latescibacterota bacterium]HJP30249.1 hypothetical protein [Candidatus Latescibacterota bacterium]
MNIGAATVAIVSLAAKLAAAPPEVGELLFHESFEDTAWASRGWYDGPHMEIVEDSDAPHGDRVNLWHWPHAGATGPSGGSARLHLPPLEDVTMSFFLRVSDNWLWTGRPYHPHMFSLLTDVDWEYVGPAYTHLTTYAEVVNGVPRLALQDGRNVDTSHVEADLTAETEARAIAGCNGDADGHGEGDCYRSGDNWVNGKVWESGRVYLRAEAGLHDQRNWHQIHARFRLNSVGDGVTRRDGKLQMWFDGELIIDVQDAVLRTSMHPGMKFNQFLMGPHYGPGVPHPQSMWIDDLKIWASPASPTAVRAASWGQAKVPPPGP